MSQLSFHYRAIGSRGNTTNGVLQADSREEAYRKLVAAGMKPLRITSRRRRGRRKRITLKELSQFTHQFSVLMEAKIPIVEGLRSIVEQEDNERLRSVVEDIAKQIEAGNTVTDAVTPHRDVFGEVYVETLRAAEASGNLIEVLTSLSEMLERQYVMQKNVKGALLYPTCVIVALTLAVTFLMIFVVPKFADLFSRRGLELPVPTQVVIAISNVLRVYWYLFLAGAVGGFFGLRAAWRRPKSRRKIDNWMHRVPFLKDVLRGVAISRFARVLGISLRSGLNVIDALEMGGRASGRPLLEVEAQKLRDQVNIGGRLSDVIVTCQYFPTFTRRMIAAGEEAAELPRMCSIVARNYDRDVEHLTKNVATVIEPVMIVGLAAVVLIIALAIFLPMWEMGALLS
ncbi:MAG: type II secretion system F family protein [Phycisphaerales bacterium]|nr:type II secretion system F family protein [Phycisphaerae bacterium]NNF43331.1 type II secretion system F family protein [Phycisphaerales bacterium]NNM25845.1 type II secretion system F family protein [Phycisphaerales bacterium]